MQLLAANAFQSSVGNFIYSRPPFKKTCQPPSPPDLPGLPFKKTLRTPYFYPHFLIFQIPLSSGEGNQNLLPPPLPPFEKQEGGSELWHYNVGNNFVLI